MIQKLILQFWKQLGKKARRDFFDKLHLVIFRLEDFILTRFLRRGAAALLTFCLALPLFGCSGSDTPTESKTPRSDTAVATLCAVGDIRVTDELLQAARQGGSYDFSDILRGTTAVVGAADVAIGNLETTLSGEPYNDGSAPDALATALRSTGFSLVQTANSYTIQNGLSGLERTKTILRSAGLTPVGTYESAEDRAQNRAVLVEANGIRIAVVAFTKGMNGMRLPSGAEYCTNLLYTDYDSNYSHIDTDGITAAIDAARALSPDIIVAALHWGSEDVSDISDTQEKIADLMFRRGVDVIVGSHSHRVGPVERRSITTDDGVQKDVVLAYGLGDYCAAQEGETNASLALTVEFTRTGESTVISNVRCTPLATADCGAGTAPRYQVLNAADAVRLYENNYYQRVSDALYEQLLAAKQQVEEAVQPQDSTK